MFEWAVLFCMFASVAAVFGFTGIVAGLAPIAKLLCYIFLSLAFLSFMAAFFPKKKTSGLILDIKYGD